MNILFLSRLYYPHVGGVEKHLKKISEILSKNHKIVIVTEQHDPALPEYQKYPEAEVYRIPVNGVSEKDKKWTIWKWFNKHQDLVKNADIIHAHDVFFWVLPLRFIHIKHKYFLTFHGYEGASPPGLKQIFWHKLGEWFTSGNISIGDFIPKWYHTKATAVSYGAAENRFKKVSARKDIIYLGRLARDTGILDYLKAATAEEVQIDVYGDGPLMDEAKSFTCEKNTKVKFYGFVPGADKLLPDYRIAFISRYLGILEALLAKVPVIAHYDSKIKKDYLSLAPFSKYIKICGNASEIIAAYHEIKTQGTQTLKNVEAGYNWVKDQTWENLAHQYELLWLENLPPQKPH